MERNIDKQKLEELVKHIEETDPEFVRDYADFFYYILSDTDSNQPINNQELSDLLKKGQQNEMASTYKNVVSLLAEGCYRNQ